jgi:hypothetical protein
MTAAPATDNTAITFAEVARAILAAGGTVLLPESDPLLAHASFRRLLLGDTVPHATLAYGEPFTQPGLHVVATESDHWVENLTGLGGCGAHLFLTLASQHGRQGHPLLPVLQVAEASERGKLPADDIDAFLSGDAVPDATQLLRLITAAAQQELTPASTATGAVDFQLSRGLLGVTT